VHLFDERCGVVGPIGGRELCGRPAACKRDQNANRHDAGGDATN
jgi:hypothetical protein